MSYTRSGTWKGDLSHRIVATHAHPTRPGYIVTVDDLGVQRSGPGGSWWTTLTPRRSNGIGVSLEAPAWRIRAWNVAAVVYAVAATWLAARLHMLVPFLLILGGLVLACAVGLWWLWRTLPARYARELGQPVPARRARPPATRPQAATAEPVAEGVS